MNVLLSELMIDWNWKWKKNNDGMRTRWRWLEWLKAKSSQRQEILGAAALMTVHVSSWTSDLNFWGLLAQAGLPTYDPHVVPSLLRLRLHLHEYREHIRSFIVVAMDWFVSPRKKGKEQETREKDRKFYIYQIDSFNKNNVALRSNAITRAISSVFN